MSKRRNVGFARLITGGGGNSSTRGKGPLSTKKIRSGGSKPRGKKIR